MKKIIMYLIIDIETQAKISKMSDCFMNGLKDGINFFTKAILENDFNLLVICFFNLKKRIRKILKNEEYLNGLLFVQKNFFELIKINWLVLN